jgi:ribosomal protein L40E
VPADLPDLYLRGGDRGGAMSLAELGPKPDQICWDCGAANAPDAPECWLCHRRDWRSDGAAAPAKAGAIPDHDPSRRSIAIAIVVGTVLLVGTGAVHAIAHGSLLAIVLGLSILWLPVVLGIASRIHRPPVSTERMTRLEFTTAATTIAVGVILLTYLQRFGDASYVLMIFGGLAIPAALITWARARSRRHAGRPMTGLQLAASILFLSVLLPTLLVTSLVIALYLVCLANGQFH